MTALPPRLEIPELERFGVRAFITTREAGDFNLAGDVNGAADRWLTVHQGLAAQGTPFLASATQVHGTSVVVHEQPSPEWRRCDAADGHVVVRGGAAAVTIADCVPVFVVHPRGAVALLHAGWRGVAGGILAEGVRRLEGLGYPPQELHVHFGPSICGRCYQVGGDVYERLTGWETARARHVDLRALLAEQATRIGVATWTASGECTKCDNTVLFSHRAGNPERQIAVLASPLALIS